MFATSKFLKFITVVNLSSNQFQIEIQRFQRVSILTENQ